MNTYLEALYPQNAREKEIEKIVNFVKEGNSSQVISLPGVGRSNLLGLLSYNRQVRIKFWGENQKKYHFVTINFSEVRKKPLIEVIKLIFLVLLDSLKARKMEKEYKIAYENFKEALELKDELVLFQGLKKTVDLIVGENITIVLLFDRFEDFIPSATPQFFSYLRILRNRAKYRFSCVFSLNRPLEESLEPVIFADFYEFLAGHTIYLPLIDKAGLEFRLSHLEKVTGKKLDQKIIEEIINLTGGHGKLTRIAAEAVLGSPNVISNKLSIFLLEQKTIKGALYEIWYSLTPSEQKTLFEKPIKSEYLEKIGLTKNGKIAIPLFEKFIKEENLGKSLEAKITFDAETNEIKKGNENLSQKLTSLEFKLLRFLIENKDRIIEREEIINAVWKDSASTLGVTDQALDQLVLRLRKKIEEDPNKPFNIETIKGRGYKFTP